MMVMMMMMMMVKMVKMTPVAYPSKMTANRKLKNRGIEK